MKQTDKTALAGRLNSIDMVTLTLEGTIWTCWGR